MPMPNIVNKPMSYVCRGVRVMGYCGPMGYGVEFPANGLGGWKKLWGKRGHGLREVWVRRGLTVFELIRPGEGKGTGWPKFNLRPQTKGKGQILNFGQGQFLLTRFF